MEKTVGRLRQKAAFQGGDTPVVLVLTPKLQAKLEEAGISVELVSFHPDSRFPESGAPPESCFVFAIGLKDEPSR